MDGVDVTEATDLEAACRAADAIVIVQAHAPYLATPAIITDAGKPVLDATGRFQGAQVERI